jgi:hypothetical protein
MRLIRNIIISFVGFLAVFSLFSGGVANNLPVFDSIPVLAADANCPNVKPNTTTPANLPDLLKKSIVYIFKDTNKLTGNEAKQVGMLAKPDKFGLTKDEACTVTYYFKGSPTYDLFVKPILLIKSESDVDNAIPLIIQNANLEVAGKKTLVSSDNRLYQEVKGIDGGVFGLTDDIDCRIYVTPNLGQSTKNYIDVSGRQCVAATGSSTDATKKCAAINASAYAEAGGRDFVQASCNPLLTVSLKGETGKIPFWTFDGDSTVVLVDNNGNNAVLGRDDVVKIICLDNSPVGGALGLLECKNTTKAEFLANYTKFCSKSENKAKCAKVVTPVTDFDSPEYTASGAATSSPSTSTLSDTSALLNDPVGTVAGAVADQAGNIFSALFNVVAAILLWFVYLLGWVAQTVLYYLGIIILFFLRTNPAGKDFFEVAVAPWTLLISITNLMILGSFVYVGFGYILNLKNLKSNVQDFLQNVVIIAIALNFTIVGTATVINITQGVGEIFIYSYAATKGGTTNEDINSAVMGGVINAIGRVSVLRCGKQMIATPATPTTTPTSTTPATPTTTPKVASTECDINKDPAGQLSTLAATSFSPITNLFSGKTGQATAALISESIFLAMICIAIFVFWKAAYMAVMRIVGLWLLMITSPIALATYLSPIDSLKPIGKKWVDKMVKWSSFYPIFIFSLVLVNLLTEKFAQINAGAQLSVVNNGAASGANEFTLSLQVILGAVISIGALYATTNFLDKDFENFAKSAAGAIGKYAKPFTAAYSTTARLAGSAIDGVTGLGFRALNIKDSKGKYSGAFSRIGQGIGGAVEGSFGGADKNLQSKNILRKALGRTQKIVGGAAKKGIFEGLGDIVEFTPYLAQGVAKAPGKLLEGFDRLRQGRAASFNEAALGGLERILRGSGNNSDVINFLDGDDNLSRWAGQGKDFIDSIENSARNNGDPSPYTLELQDRILDAGKKAMKTAGKKLSPIIARALGETIANDFPTDVNSWTPEQSRVFEQILNQAADDDGLARQVFSNRRSIKFAQQKFDTLDSTVQTKLADKEPQLMGDDEARMEAGQEYATDTERFKAASARNFADEKIVEGYQKAGGDMQELFKKTGRGYDLPSQQAAKAEVDLAFGGKATGKVASAELIANREIGNNFVAENNLVRQQVALRQNKLTWDALMNTTDVDLQRNLDAVKTELSGSVANFNALSADQQKELLKTRNIDFKSQVPEFQDKALDHLEAENSIKEFGHNVNDSDILEQIKGTAYEDMNDAQRDEVINKYAGTHVGQEAIAKLGAEYTTATQKEQIEILRRTVANKAVSYKKSQSANQSRIKQASARYASAHSKGSQRARVHGIAENAIENAAKSKNWEDPNMFQVVGAAKIQNKFEGAASQGNQKISDILGKDIGFTNESFNNKFIDTTNENQRKRDMMDLSNALGDYHSTEPGARDKAKAVFKDKFGIDLDATTKSIVDPNNPGQTIQVPLTMGDPNWQPQMIPDPNSPGQLIPDPNDVQPRIAATNAQILEQKLLSTGQEYMNQEYIVRERGVNGQPGAIDYTRTQSQLGSAKKEFEALKNNKMTEEISSSGGENFASKASEIFGKHVFK